MRVSSGMIRYAYFVLGMWYSYSQIDRSSDPTTPEGLERTALTKNQISSWKIRSHKVLFIGNPLTRKVRALFQIGNRPTGSKQLADVNITQSGRSARLRSCQVVRLTASPMRECQQDQRDKSPEVL